MPDAGTDLNHQHFNQGHFNITKKMRIYNVYNVILYNAMQCNAEQYNINFNDTP